MHFVDDLLDGPMKTDARPQGAQPPQGPPPPPPGAQPPQGPPPPPSPPPQGPPSTQDELQESLRATRFANRISLEDAQTQALVAQQQLLRAQADGVRAQAETVALQSKTARQQAELNNEVVNYALQTIARIKEASSAPTVPQKSGAEVAGESFGRVVDSVKEIVKTALVVRGQQRLLALGAAPAAPPAEAAGAAAAQGEGEAAAGAADSATPKGAAASSILDLFPDGIPDLGVIFPNLPEELKGMPLEEMRDVLLTYAQAKKRGPQ